MNVEDLIQAHKLYASWQRSDLATDFDNACSMTFLSIAPAASQVELQARRGAIEAIWQRQAHRMDAAQADLLADGVDPENLTRLILVASEAAASAMMQFALENLISRHLRDL